VEPMSSPDRLSVAQLPFILILIAGGTKVSCAGKDLRYLGVA